MNDKTPRGEGTDEPVRADLPGAGPQTSEQDAPTAPADDPRRTETDAGDAAPEGDRSALPTQPVAVTGPDTPPARRAAGSGVAARRAATSSAPAGGADPATTSAPTPTTTARASAGSAAEGSEPPAAPATSGGSARAASPAGPDAAPAPAPAAGTAAAAGTAGDEPPGDEAATRPMPARRDERPAPGDQPASGEERASEDLPTQPMPAPTGPARAGGRPAGAVPAGKASTAATTAAAGAAPALATGAPAAPAGPGPSVVTPAGSAPTRPVPARTPAATTPAAATTAPPAAASQPTAPVRPAAAAASAAGAPGTTEPAAAAPGTTELAAGPAPAKRSRLGLTIGLGALLLLGLYLLLALSQGDTIPSGTKVAGVDVGGLDREEATTRLTARSRALAAEPITLKVGDRDVQVVPAQAGLSLDPQASLEGLGGRSLNPVTVLGRLGGGDERDGVVRVDRTRLADVISQRVGRVVSSAPKDGSVSFRDGEVVVVRSTPGQGVDAEAVAAQVADGWPAQRTWTAQLSSREPRLTNAEITRFVEELAQPAMSGPVVLTAGGTQASLSPKQLSGVITVTQQGNRLTASVDGAKAAEAARAVEPGLDRPAQDARVVFTGGRPSIKPSEDGTVIDEKKLGPALLAALTSPQRTVAVPTVAQKATVTADRLGDISTTVLTEFRSRFPDTPNNAARTHNIRTALRQLDGQVVAPGATFSLVKALGGELTEAKGYRAAPTIQGGLERDALGGGVSQVSTTMYNAAFFAGVRLGTHQAHSFWIPRYPMGREATLWVPYIDNTWTNDTGKPIVIGAGTEGDEAVIRFYGVRRYQVQTTTGPKYNIVKPKKVADDHPECIPIPPQDGFSVDVKRVLTQGGRVVRTENVHTDYKPADEVTCTHPEAQQKK